MAAAAVPACTNEGVAGPMDTAAFVTSLSAESLPLRALALLSQAGLILRSQSSVETRHGKGTCWTLTGIRSKEITTETLQAQLWDSEAVETIMQKMKSSPTKMDQPQIAKLQAMTAANAFQFAYSNKYHTTAVEVVALPKPA